jgi:uncharacterized membrane protein
MWVRFEPRAMGHGWWPGIVGDLVPLLFLIALLAFGIWAVRRITEQDRMLAVGAGARTPANSDGALEELRLRYARGDLDRAGYVQRLHDLGGEEPEPPPPSPPPPPDAA